MGKKRLNMKLSLGIYTTKQSAGLEQFEPAREIHFSDLFICKISLQRSLFFYDLYSLL